MGYIGFNFQKINYYGNLDAENLECVRQFENSKSETGFMAVHIAMVQHTPELVREALALLDSAE